MRALNCEADERRLVEAAQRDRSRFALLYEQNFARVYAYVARRSPGREVAEDVTSEVFKEALSSLPEFEWRGTPFIAWLYGIAANLLAEHWRKDRGCREVQCESLPEVGHEPSVERAAMLAQLVEALPDDQQLVVRARFVEQKSIREIAQQLRRSEGAVKQLQFRALQTLRARLGGGHVG